eukprot:Hpha_TRINITY_DN5311_c0_g1::TRINITY_DN5311_c0_g1_i2::g.32931::m.32931
MPPAHIGACAAADYLLTLPVAAVVQALDSVLAKRSELRVPLFRSACAALQVPEGLVALCRVPSRRQSGCLVVARPQPSNVGGSYTDGELRVFTDSAARRHNPRYHTPSARPEDRALPAPELSPRWQVTPRPPPPHRPQDGPVLDSRPLALTQVDQSKIVQRLSQPVQPRHKASDRVAWRDPVSGLDVCFEHGVGCVYYSAPHSAPYPALRIWCRPGRSQQEAEAKGSGLNDGEAVGTVLRLVSRLPPDFAEHGTDVDAPKLHLPTDEEEAALLLKRLRALCKHAGVRHNIPTPNVHRGEETARSRSQQRAHVLCSDLDPKQQRAPLTAVDRDRLMRRLHDEAPGRTRKLMDDLRNRHAYDPPGLKPCRPLSSEGVAEANARLFYDEINKRRDLTERREAETAAPLGKTVEREASEIEAATERLYEMARQNARMRNDDLKRKYLPRPPAARFDTKEQADQAVARLYESAEQRQERQQKLWTHHVGKQMQSAKKLSPAEIRATVERLGSK